MAEAVPNPVIWDWFCRPKSADWNIFLLGVYTGLSVISNTIMMNVTKNWRIEENDGVCVDTDPTFLKETAFEVFVSIAGFFLPVLFYKVHPETISMMLQFLDLIYILQFLYPVRVVIRVLMLIQKRCKVAKKICQHSIAAVSSIDNSGTTVRNTGILLMVTSIGTVLAEQIILYYFINDTSRTRTYAFIITLIVLKMLSIFCMTKCETKRDMLLNQIILMSIQLVKTKEIWLCIYFFLYLGGQEVFNDMIYPTMVPHQKICHIHLSNPRTALSMTLGVVFGSFLLIFLTRTFKRFDSIVFGLILNLTTYASIYLSYPLEKSVLKSPLVMEKREILTEIVFPFFLGMARACTQTEMFLLLSYVYTKEISSVYAIYEFILRITEKILPSVHKKFSLSSTLIILSVFGVTGTITFLITFKKQIKREMDQGTTTQNNI